VSEDEKEKHEEEDKRYVDDAESISPAVKMSTEEMYSKFTEN
jgi:hypothetical protein